MNMRREEKVLTLDPPVTCLIRPIMSEHSDYLSYLSAAGGHLARPAVGSPHSPRVTKHLAAPSDRPHRISANTEVFRKRYLFKSSNMLFSCGELFFSGFNINNHYGMR